MTPARKEAERLAGEALPHEEWIRAGLYNMQCTGNPHLPQCPAFHRPAVTDILEPLLAGNSAMRTGMGLIAREFIVHDGQRVPSAMAEVAHKVLAETNLPSPPTKENG